MKRYITTLIIAVLATAAGYAQSSVSTASGHCGTDIKWTYDGMTLTLTNVSTKGLMASMDNYNEKKPAPWIKRGLNIQRVKVGSRISSIGSYAFAGLT